MKFHIPSHFIFFLIFRARFFSNVPNILVIKCVEHNFRKSKATRKKNSEYLTGAPSDGFLQVHWKHFLGYPDRVLPLSIAFWIPKILGFSEKNSVIWGMKCEKFPKIVGNLLNKLRKLYMNGTVTLEIFSPPQGIENSIQFLLLRTVSTGKSPWVSPGM